MKILIADDEPVSRRMLQATMAKWGYDIIVCEDGQQAWQTLQDLMPPSLAVLDWLMPGIDGAEICRMVRSTPALRSMYVILVTSRGNKQDIVSGLEAGADDYITKPFDPDELLARVRVGLRVARLQTTLAERVRDLESALSRVHQLQGLLPICCYCKKIRDDRNYWHQVESYVSQHADVRFSHGVCPDCLNKLNNS
jgi:sigma-B regulation protein RsbU (phosphoserine phosphatase)